MGVRVFFLAILVVLSNSLSCNLMGRASYHPSALEREEMAFDIADACRRTVTSRDPFNERHLTVFLPEESVMESCLDYFTGQGWIMVSKQRRRVLIDDPFQAQEGSLPRLRWGTEIRFRR